MLLRNKIKYLAIVIIMMGSLCGCTNTCLYQKGIKTENIGKLSRNTDISQKKICKAIRESKLNKFVRVNKRFYIKRNVRLFTTKDKKRTSVRLSKGSRVRISSKNKRGWSMVRIGKRSYLLRTKYLTRVWHYNKTSLYLLSHVINGEARGSTWNDMLGVGSVVLNRMKSKKFPSTMRGVIFAHRQYACIWDGQFYLKPTKKSVKAAKYLLRKGSFLNKKFVWQSGAKQGKNQIHIGGHWYGQL